MARMGLDEKARNFISSLVEDRASGERVREAIRSRVRQSDYDYQKNLTFVRWLRDRRYDESAEYLVRYLEGRM